PGGVRLAAGPAAGGRYVAGQPHAAGGAPGRAHCRRGGCPGAYGGRFGGAARCRSAGRRWRASDLASVSRRVALTTARHFPFLQTAGVDRKSTRLNSSHVKISYAVFCLKKKIIYLSVL